MRQNERLAATTVKASSRSKSGASEDAMTASARLSDVWIGRCVGSHCFPFLEPEARGAKAFPGSVLGEVRNLAADWHHRWRNISCLGQLIAVEKLVQQCHDTDVFIGFADKMRAGWHVQSVGTA